MEEKLDEIIKKINNSESKYGKWLKALDKALNNIEKIINWEISYLDLVDLLYDENATIFSDIKNALWELISDSIDLILAFLDDISIYIIWVTEVWDYKKWKVVKKAEEVKKWYNTWIPFIDDIKYGWAEVVIQQSALFRWVETAIFENISWLSKVDIWELIKWIIDNIPDIIDIVWYQLKGILNTIRNLEMEDIAFITWYIWALILFPLKDFFKYLKWWLVKVITRVTWWNTKKIEKIMKKIENLKDWSFWNKIDNIKKWIERSATIAKSSHEQSQRIT